MENFDYSHVVGVFRDADSARQAIGALQQAGIGEGQIEFLEQSTGENTDSMLNEDGRRFLVQVQAAGQEQEAVDIMAHHGANNADIPPGTILVRGKLVHGSLEDEYALAQQAAAANAEAESGTTEQRDEHHSPA